LIKSAQKELGESGRISEKFRVSFQGFLGIRERAVRDWTPNGARVTRIKVLTFSTQQTRDPTLRRVELRAGGARFAGGRTRRKKLRNEPNSAAARGQAESYDRKET
jgi:hypothetical protein